MRNEAANVPAEVGTKNNTFKSALNLRLNPENLKEDSDAAHQKLAGITLRIANLRHDMDKMTVSPSLIKWLQRLIGRKDGFEVIDRANSLLLQDFQSLL